MKQLRVAITTNILPKYREGFYDRLFSRKDVLVTVYCQDHVPGMNFQTIHERYPNNVRVIKFLSAKADKMVWQFLPWKELINDYDVVFISGNPRVLSDVIFGTFLRIFKKNVILWTMAHAYGANPITEKLRLYWSGIFKMIFVYNDGEVDYLVSKGFKNKVIIGMNNGLDQKKIDDEAVQWTKDRLLGWRKSRNLDKAILILSCARLDPKNKFEQVLLALPEIIKTVPNIKWALIGGGKELSKLVNLADSLGISDYVTFVGEVYEESELAPWFLSSKLLVHPAAIGLSILHAFGYGLPLVTHGEATLHGPEYDAFEPNLTGANFEMNNVEQLSKTIINLIENPVALANMRKYTIALTRGKYNVDIMAERFVEIAKIAVGQLH